MFRLRPATIDDADFLLELKNDPVMRKFAVVTHNKIKKADHIKWLSKNLHTFQIVEVDKKPAGMLRVTDDMEVSINLHPDFRGQGLGTKVMKKCPRKVWAKIVDGNTPSMKLFTNSGFRIIDHIKNYYVLYKD